MAEFEIKVNNKNEIIRTMKERVLTALEECGLDAEAYAKEACPVDTGALRSSITHVSSAEDGTGVMVVGTNKEYAIYVEYGTGIYAQGGGRQTPWAYQDDKGNWHRTSGQRAQPYIKPAIADHAEHYKNIIKSVLEG